MRASRLIFFFRRHGMSNLEDGRCLFDSQLRFTFSCRVSTFLRVTTHLQSQLFFLLYCGGGFSGLYRFSADSDFLPQLSGEGGTTYLSLHEAPVFTRLPSHTYSHKYFFCSVLKSFCPSCSLPVVSGLEILLQMS